jgi:signal transduction histidine kinase
VKQWPLAAGATLGALATVETALRSGDAGVVALGLCATLPLALVRRRPVAVAVALTLATAVTAIALGPPTATGVLASLVAWAVVVQRRVERARVDADAHAAVESTLLELTARGERARIARELHDVVAHHISMISVQAETARVATPGMPPEGAERLQAIGDTARTALAEMRRLLGVLREDQDGNELTPQPGLGQLDALIERVRGAGVEVAVKEEGEPRELPASLDLSAYRILQEALTNVRKHAKGAPATVRLEWGAQELRLEVADRGPGANGTAPGEGHGLVGMRERVKVHGGELRAGTRDEGGFEVHATLPLP